MSFQYDTDSQENPTAQEESQFWAQQLTRYLAPYHERLDAYLDRRVVGNLTATVAAIVQTHSELTTSALGSAICGPAHAEAGTQRLQRALHHEGWEAEVIEEVLWQEAEKRRQQMQQQGETPLCIWVSLVLEKPESEKLEGLGAVRSSRVRRLARSRKGLFNQPSRMPVSVRGFEWESLLLLGSSGVPQVVAMKWWSRHKGVPGQQRKPQHVLLSQVAQRWGRQVRHVFDRGYGNGPWLWLLCRYLLEGSPQRETSDEAIARQQSQIAALEKQLADAKQQVQDIAVRAIEGASGAKALSHINQIAMEQAKNRPQG